MRYKLIVADRSPSVQKAIQLAFPSSEFDIFLFENGLEVIKNLSQINPDAIILSLSLPEKDGYEVGFFLKSQKEFRKTPLVFLKGTFETLNKQKIANIDYDEIVQKPFDSLKLTQKIKEIIERNQNPTTFPEEPLLDEMTLKDYKEEIQYLIQEQISKAERELEEKIKEKILKDLKELVRKELEMLLKFPSLKAKTEKDRKKRRIKE